MPVPLGDHQSLWETAQRGGAVTVLVGVAGYVVSHAKPILQWLERWFDHRSEQRDKADQAAALSRRRSDLDHAQDEIYERLQRQVERLERRLLRLERELRAASQRETKLRETFAELRVIAESDRRTIERMQAAGQPIDLATFLDLPQIPDLLPEPALGDDDLEETHP